MKQILFDLSPAAIKQARIEAGFKNVRDAAAAIGMSHTMLNEIEASKKYGSIPMLAKICRAYGIKLIIDENTAEAWN